jgi:flagellar biosynthesis protein FlhA
VPKICSVGDVQRVLRQLLRERVPVRDLSTILESMADASAVSKDPDVITETVRAALGRSVCRPYQAENGDLRVIALSPALEDALAASVTRTDRGAVLALDPERAQRLAGRLGEVLAHEELAQPVLLCTPSLRPHLWRLFSRALPHIAVLSHSEVPAQMRVMAVATLD